MLENLVVTNEMSWPFLHRDGTVWRFAGEFNMEFTDKEKRLKKPLIAGEQRARAFFDLCNMPRLKNFVMCRDLPPHSYYDNPDGYYWHTARVTADDVRQVLGPECRVDFNARWWHSIEETDAKRWMKW